uniref:Host-protective antigen n=1 Tax=Taenia ovis TaxID=6203 RepID=Q27416_TAEOV|nr:host-protective antigen [Taenia ovis]AAC46951.1 host-protective antigen [Taenia ovis]prf//2202315A host protective antigen [Taenia ovis]
MPTQLCLIVLATAVLASDYEQPIERTVVEYPSLRDIFAWEPPTSNSIGLTWQRHAFPGVEREVLTLKAVPTSEPNNTKTAYAKLGSGKVTLDGLKPNATYLVTATANISGDTILVLSNTFHTLANGTNIINNIFHWGPVTNQSIQVRWDQIKPEETSALIVTLTAEMASDPGVERSESALFGKGKVTVDGLESDTLYIATVMVFRNGRQYFNSTRDIRTLKSGHKEVTVVTTSGSGIASTILGLLLTCVALVLA